MNPSETFTLPHRRMACALAEIEIGHRDGEWFNAVRFQQDGGDSLGHGEPLNCDRPLPDRDAALSDATDRLREMMNCRPSELAPQLAWLDTLVPDQPDLFSNRKAA